MSGGVRRELPGGFELDDDPGRVDVDAVHAFIANESYWGRERPRERTEAAIRGARRVVGLYHEGALVGFARAVSDGATVAYLADVYVLPRYQGRGLGLELVREIVDGSEVAFGRGVRWMLHTADAQGLYTRIGFADRVTPYALMERARDYDSAP
ncbi:MAG TPA: GNAT family N-acetyltransferase [Solirubrobacteraceae bacterium]|nr:GNAT family N-acetyltransferase [Solirubrobacteraceae bacterium]